MKTPVTGDWDQIIIHFFTNHNIQITKQTTGVKGVIKLGKRPHYSFLITYAVNPTLEIQKDKKDCNIWNIFTTLDGSTKYCFI